MKRFATLFFAVFALSDTTGQTAQSRFPASGGDVVITPLIHASVQIEHAGKVIQVDPWSVGDHGGDRTGQQEGHAAEGHQQHGDEGRRGHRRGNAPAVKPSDDRRQHQRKKKGDRDRQQQVACDVKEADKKDKKYTEEDVAAGEAPASSGRGPLAELCRDLLSDLLPRRGGRLSARSMKDA